MPVEGSSLDHPIRSNIRSPRFTQQSSANFNSKDGRVRYPARVRWVCVRCTDSCSDLPGRTRNVLLAPFDVKRITDATKLAAREFSVSTRAPAPYTRKIGKREGRCIFLRGSTCSIYRVRPLICRFYPFCIRPSGTASLEIGVDLNCSGIGTGPKRGEKFFRHLVELARTELRVQ